MGKYFISLDENWWNISHFLGLLVKTKHSPYCYYPVWLCLVSGIILSSAAALTVKNSEQARKTEQFNNAANSLTVNIQNEVDDLNEVMRSLGALYDASQTVTETEFAHFSRQKLTYNSTLVGLGWAKQVKGKSEVYFPTIYAEPSEKLDSLQSYDIGSLWQQRVALERAISISDSQSSIIVTTEQLQLPQSFDKSFFLYRPVYESTGEEQLTGIVYGLFRADTLIKTAIRKLKVKNLDFYLYQTTIDQLDSALLKKLDSLEENFLLFYESESQQLTTDATKAQLIQFLGEDGNQLQCAYSQDWNTCLRTINLEGQEWTLLILPTTAFADHFPLSGAVFAIGLLTTSSIVIYLYLTIKKNIQTEKLVKELTVANQTSAQQTVELQNTLYELRNTQAQLVHTEKMSSLGQLVAGVAHEINNPVSFIYGNINYTSQYAQELLGLVELYGKHYPQPHQEIATEIDKIELDFLQEDLPKTLASMEVGTTRIREIVKSMRNFSRIDEAKMKLVDIHQGLESTLMILGHRFKAKGDRLGIEVVKAYGDLPLVECNAGQLNQVFMNLLSNAVDALEEAQKSNCWGNNNTLPTITIMTKRTLCSSVLISIRDNGEGIPERISSRLFEPFFTTKPAGKGTGLGLSISYQIVTEFHKGKLQCFSQPGEGTEFIIELPQEAH